jgi:hypothetical protein
MRRMIAYPRIDGVSEILHFESEEFEFGNVGQFEMISPHKPRF